MNILEQFLHSIAYKFPKGYPDLNDKNDFLLLENEFKKIGIDLDELKNFLDLMQSTIVFACTKDHVLALTALCRAKGIESGFIIGEVPQSERIKLLNELYKNKINYNIIDSENGVLVILKFKISCQ